MKEKDLTTLSRNELIRYGREVYKWPNNPVRWAETHRINAETMSRENKKKK